MSYATHPHSTHLLASHRVRDSLRPCSLRGYSRFCQLLLHRDWRIQVDQITASVFRQALQRVRRQRPCVRVDIFGPAREAHV